MKEPRTSTTRLLVVALISMSSAVAGAVASKVAEGTSGPERPAQLWLSWSPKARETYVWGYLDGFDRGKHEGCWFHGEKMEVYMPKPVPIETSPQAVCLDALPRYTESDVHVYADAITKYFLKYPSDAGVGPPTIMSQLASPPSLSIDQIHAKLTGR